MDKQLNRVLERLRYVAGRAEAELTDRQLLDHFARERDEASFARLVRRHGPMVLGVCRRVLRDPCDAEDVFQAAFLILARKAPSIRWRQSVGGWLYTVSRRLAQKARSQRERRQRLEAAAAGPEPMIVPAPPHDGLRAVLDEELSRLPEHHRTVVLLCYVEGRTQGEAARHLGWTPGQVRGALDRARSTLRRRLARRGLDVSAGVLGAALLGAAAAPAAVPATLAAHAVRFAAGERLAHVLSPHVLSLTLGGLKMFSATKLSTVAATITAALLLSGGTASYWVRAQDSGPPVVGAPAAAPVNPGLVAPAAPVTREVGIADNAPTAEPNSADKQRSVLQLFSERIGLDDRAPTNVFTLIDEKGKKIIATKPHVIEYAIDFTAAPSLVAPLLKDSDPIIRDLAAQIQQRLAQRSAEAARAHTSPLIDLYGRLLTTDPVDSVQKRPAQRFFLYCRKGMFYEMDLHSKEFDSYLRLEDTSGKELLKDDDSGGNLDARIIFRPESDGNYQVVVTSFDGRSGRFHLTVREQNDSRQSVTQKIRAYPSQPVPRPIVPSTATFSPYGLNHPTPPATTAAPVMAPAQPDYQRQIRELQDAVKTLQRRLDEKAK